MGRKSATWLWNVEVKQAISKNNEAHKAICWISTEENKRRHRRMKNKTNKAVSKAMR